MKSLKKNPQNSKGSKPRYLQCWNILSHAKRSEAILADLQKTNINASETIPLNRMKGVPYILFMKLGLPGTQTKQVTIQQQQKKITPKEHSCKS